MERFEEGNRKRRISGDNYEGSNKLGRMDTPPGRHVRRTPSPPGRMVPVSKRERSPPQQMRERPRASPLMRRSPFEEVRRVEPRRDGKQHYSSPTPYAKPNDNDRDRQYSTNFGNKFDPQNYNRGDRQRERLAPSRDAPQSQGLHDRPPQHDDRRNIIEVENKGRRAPLLPFPSESKTNYPYQNTGPGNLSRNEAFNRNQGISSFKKRSPLIVKTKEALIEKYEDLKQSRVDMWVDETVRGGQACRRSPTPIKPYSDERGNSISPVERTKGKSDSIGSEFEKCKDIEEDQLSDFSDDADDILTKEVKEPTIVKEIENPVKPNQDLVDSDTAKVSSSNLREDISQTKATEQVQSSVSVTPAPADIRSQSQSQTDDDLLEQMDFEEISDDELGESENKIGIVDALGVDWSSLVCRDKKDKVVSEGKEGDGISPGKKLKDKWSAANIFKQVGLSRRLAGDELFEKVFTKVKEMEERNGVTEPTTSEELEFPNSRRKRLERKHLLDDIGIGPCSRALSARRDLAVRRYLLNMIPKSLVSMDMLNQTSTRTQPEEEYNIRPTPKCSVVA